MIVLDASVLIGFLDSRDGHHEAACSLLEDSGIESLGVSVLTLAEALVTPARSGRSRVVVDVLEGLGVVELSISDPVRLAEIRARTGLKMPDCCVLVAAEDHQASVATFDDALANAASTLGLRTAGPS